MSLNTVILSGNLTRDPELRYMPSGMAVCAVTVAINSSWMKDGQKMEDTTFVDCVAYQKQAENIAQFFKKGKGIIVEGRLKMEKWTDNATKQPRSKMVMVIGRFHFMDSKSAEKAEEKSGDPDWSVTDTPTKPAATTKESRMSPESRHVKDPDDDLPV